MVHRFIALSLALAFAATAEAADKPASAETAAPKVDAAKGQQVAAQICAACHNPDGNSAVAANPKLAGQHAEYIYKQLKNFKADGGKPAERNSPVMGGMVAALTDQDMKNVAAWYASQAQKGERPSAGHRVCTEAVSCRRCRPRPARLRRLPWTGRRRHSGPVPAHRRPVCRIHRGATQGLPCRRARQRSQQDDARRRRQDVRRRNQGHFRLRRRPALSHFRHTSKRGGACHPFFLLSGNKPGAALVYTV